MIAPSEAGASSRPYRNSALYPATAVAPSASTSGKSRRVGRTKPPRRAAQTASRSVASVNRVAATVNGVTASTASLPAGHVPPKQTAIANSSRYAVRRSLMFEPTSPRDRVCPNQPCPGTRSLDTAGTAMPRDLVPGHGPFRLHEFVPLVDRACDLPGSRAKGSYRREMGRHPRPQVAGALYHVTTRGNSGAPIFADDLDRGAFLQPPWPFGVAIRVEVLRLLPDGKSLPPGDQDARSEHRARNASPQRLVRTALQLAARP